MNQALEEDLTETPREWSCEVFAGVLEDFAFAEAIREGCQTERVGRDEVFDVLEGRGLELHYRDRRAKFSQRINWHKMKFECIATARKISVGKPCVRELRFPVSWLLGPLTAGRALEGILEV